MDRLDPHTVKRFSPISKDGKKSALMLSNDMGDWVSINDYWALKAEWVSEKNKIETIISILRPR